MGVYRARLPKRLWGYPSCLFQLLVAPGLPGLLAAEQ